MTRGLPGNAPAQVPLPYGACPATQENAGSRQGVHRSQEESPEALVNLVARHPYSEDVVLKLFLSFSGSDVQNKLKESAQCVGDEFMNCKLATRAKDFLPADIQAQFAISRELIRNIYNSFTSFATGPSGSRRGPSTTRQISYSGRS